MERFEEAADTVDAAYDILKASMDVWDASVASSTSLLRPYRPRGWLTLRSDQGQGQTTAAPSAPAQAPQGSVIRSTAPWIAGHLYSVVPPVALSAVPDNSGKWFAITRGQYIGLTQNSAISLNAVSGFSTALSEKFNNQGEALSHFNSARASGALAIIGH